MISNHLLKSIVQNFRRVYWLFYSFWSNKVNIYFPSQPNFEKLFSGFISIFFYFPDKSWTILPLTSFLLLSSEASKLPLMSFFYLKAKKHKFYGFLIMNVGKKFHSQYLIFYLSLPPYSVVTPHQSFLSIKLIFL
jgi:hypothetical protein